MQVSTFLSSVSLQVHWKCLQAGLSNMFGGKCCAFKNVLSATILLENKLHILIVHILLLKFFSIDFSFLYIVSTCRENLNADGYVFK